MVTIPLTYSATTSNANLKMTNQPGYTFANAYNGCSDGYFPIDGMLLGNSYRASPGTSLTRAVSGLSLTLNSPLTPKAETGPTPSCRPLFSI